MYLLDTDVLIDYQRGFSPARRWFETLEATPSVSGFTIMELIQGAKTIPQVRDVKYLVSPLIIEWPSEIDCGLALLWYESYHLSHGLGLLDSFIASTAMGLSATLCTLNKKHFSMIDGLHVLAPYSRTER